MGNHLFLTSAEVGMRIMDRLGEPSTFLIRISKNGLKMMSLEVLTTNSSIILIKIMLIVATLLPISLKYERCIGKMQ